MSENRLKRRKLHHKLFTKNRLVILNEETFEELFSFKLNLMNVFVAATSGAILLITFTTFIIAFTPLREFIPGYSSSKLKKDATELALKSDSLTLALQQNEAYIKSIQKVLTGELEYAKFNKDSILASASDTVSKADLSPSKEELELRKEVAKEEKNTKSNASKAKK
ncbi:peptidase [Flavobacterium alvei]|uniref:Peptidase n=1 Tax=Flavobacterium alvei TaxID=2080416 RepID=A0A2S5AC89_9FLAO|nr:peptidase [Flavobacterium alvei]POY39929.1 peptidase [Flavobacterium alvei]HQE35144.1 peptidase [Flavobacterium alvei]HQF48227.1 peptidase [Flavobacterium alvei]HQK41004.1 peptidase [Flavobacterium alvei]